jgi:hypothetical protein
MCLDMCSETNSQLFRGIEHELAVSPYDRGINYDRRCLNILELAAEKVMFEGCVRGLRDKRWCMEWWCCVQSSHFDNTISIALISVYDVKCLVSRFMNGILLPPWYRRVGLAWRKEEDSGKHFVVLSFFKPNIKTTRRTSTSYQSKYFQQNNDTWRSHISHALQVELQIVEHPRSIAYQPGLSILRQSPSRLARLAAGSGQHLSATRAREDAIPISFSDYPIGTRRNSNGAGHEAQSR